MTPKIIDNQSDDNLDAVFGSIITVGSILSRFMEYTNPPKLKYYVIIGFSTNHKDLIYALINSIINPNLPEHIKQSHYLIESCRYTFLNHNSYVDCSRVKECRFSTIRHELRKNTNSHHGNLIAQDLKNVQNLACNSEQISKATKEVYNLL